MFYSELKHFVIFTLPLIASKRRLLAKSAPIKPSKRLVISLTIYFSLFINTQCIIPTFAKVTRSNEVSLAGKQYPYLYQWTDSDAKPRAVIIAIHGILMHGRTYEHLAEHLAKEGMIVLSPDLPGCGRRCKKEAVSYTGAAEEIAAIARDAKATYKNLPVICLGESLGANLALSTAEQEPQAVDGIILSSPALKRRVNVSPKIVVGSTILLVGLVKTDTMVDISPYVRAYASEDPTIVQTMMSDPLMHKQVTSQEVLDGYSAMKNVIKRAKLVNKNTPVLIIQGSQDKILKADAIIKLVSNLGSEDQTVKWINNKGHVILEECEPKTDVLLAIDDWFRTHIERTVARNEKDNELPSPAALAKPVPAILGITAQTKFSSNP